ncbi:MAG: ORF6N domain-containing protein [Pedobacter sp.]|nr:MAG: ORF6N domain-containing protein [Pedobacter sp.]
MTCTINQQNEREKENLPDEMVMNKIFHIKGIEVMVDRDLADFYEVQTRNLAKAVGRNLKRFTDEDFICQLTEGEFKNLMFQIRTSSWGGARKPP